MHLKKTFAGFILALSVISFIFSGCASKSPAITSETVKGPDPSRLVYPPMPDLKIPVPEKFTLPNGMEILLLEDHRLPLIELSTIVKVSTYYDPPDKVGLGEITGSVMRTGGTENMKGDEIDEKLESIAAVIETYVDEDYGGAYLNCLKENFDTALPILADILKKPVFDKDKIDLAKNELKAAISRRNDDITQITIREFKRLLWGNNSPKGRLIEYDTLANITRQDLIEFHKDYFVPNATIIGIVGDFDKNEMKAKLEKTFAGWEKGPVNYPDIKHQTESKPGVYYIYKEDTKQSNIAIGYIAPEMQYNNPDYPAVALLNYILGESFSSRLFREIRTTRGLAYHISGSFHFSFDEPGNFVSMCQTKLSSTSQAIDAIKEVITKTKNEKITNEEFNMAKNALLNSFVFDFAKNKQILQQNLRLEFYDYPLDFYSGFRQKLEKVTIDDISNVASKYLDPSNFIILVVGKKDEFDAPLDKYGEYVQLNIAIPEPSQAPLPDPTPETINAGKNLMVKVVKAYGGAKKLKTNTGRKEEYKITLTMPQGEFAFEAITYSEFPYKNRMEFKTPMGTMITGFDGETAWRDMGGQVKELPNSDIDQIKLDAKKQLRWIARYPEELTIYQIGEEKLEGKDTVKLIVKDGEIYLGTLYVDKKTNLIIMKSSPGKDQFTGAPAIQEEFMYDFKVVDGITVPTRQVIKQNGKKVMEIKVNKIVMNPKIDPALFKMKKKN